jgi:hypothetical protein
MISKVNLLTLKGLHNEDFSAPITSYEAPPAPVDVAAYNEIPPKFTSVAEWCKVRTNLLCWECSLTPAGYPKFIPENPHNDSEDSCTPKGNFCEWTCVVTYVYKNYPRDKVSDILETVAFYESKFSGKYRQRLPTGLDRVKMKAYCGAGGITPAEFREKNAAIYRDNELNTFKMEHLDLRSGRVVK